MVRQENENVPKTVESLRLELERCRRELDERQKRMKQMEDVFARLADAILAAKSAEQNRGEALPEGENRVLEMFSKGNPLQFFDALCRLVEENDQLREDFRDLFEEAPIPYVHEALDTRFIRANRAAMQVLGIKPEEIAGIFGNTFLAKTPETQQRLREAFKSVEKGREAGGVELELRRKDNGKPVWVQWWSRPAPNGSFTRTIMVDITERVLIEQTKAALELTLKSGQIGDWDLDLINHTSRRSLRHDQCFGYIEPIPEAKWGIKVFSKHLHPEDRARVVDSLRRAATELLDWGSEFRVVWADGSLHWLAARGSIYRTNEGKATRMLGIVMDITDRKRAEEALFASEQLARGQLEALKSTLDVLAMESVPDRLVEHLLRTITQKWDAHSCSVWLRDEDSATICFELAFEDDRIVKKTDRRFGGMDLRLPMEDFWPWPEVFRTGKPRAC